jgi:hypothetical protein
VWLIGPEDTRAVAKGRRNIHIRFHSFIRIGEPEHRPSENMNAFEVHRYINTCLVTLYSVQYSLLFKAKSSFIATTGITSTHRIRRNNTRTLSLLVEGQLYNPEGREFET